MKKVININFHGRVIPIEESAYDMLKQYVERLSLFFANEEGRDEIINDIEGRIAELFGEILKKGSTCIVEDDVTHIINSMGRPEDFEAEEAHVKSQLSDDFAGGERRRGSTYTSSGASNFYRDENNKVLGGVCSGIAAYFNIDPLIVRILFIIFVFAGGVSFLVYFILWIVIPGTSAKVIGSQRKRLFRDSDGKLVAGVCSGLAQYFSVQVWIPRLLFLIPFLSFVFRWGNWGWWDFPHFVSFSFSPGAVFVYIIFWLVLPEAKTTADKLEMKGEKVDLNNIKSTIQGDMEGFKGRAQQFGNEMKDRAQELGNSISNAGKRAGAEAGTVVKKSGSGIAKVLAILIKIFIYFIVGSIVFSIVIALFAVGVVCTGLLPAYSYILHDGFQKLLAWGTLIFFIWVPVIGMVTWIIRRLTNKRGSSGIIRLTIISLWVLGWICAINLLVQIKNEFEYRNYPVEQSIALSNARVNKLEIKYKPFGTYYTSHWYKLEPFSSFDDDTAYVSNVRIRIIKSTSDSFKVFMVKLSNGNTKANAEQLASKINFNISQLDSTLLLDKGIAINKTDKFRNQQVIITVAVPVGKRIMVNESMGWNNDVRLDLGHDNDYYEWENNMESRAYSWNHDVEYVMTAKGLERLDKSGDEEAPEDLNNGDENSEDNNALEQFKKSKEQLQREKEQKQKELEQIDKELQKPDSTYHYKPANPVAPALPQKSAKQTVQNNVSTKTDPGSLTDLLMVRFAL